MIDTFLTTIPALGALGLFNSLHYFGRCSQGLMLITAPAGSGKNTTVGALIDHVNDTLSRHILSIKDPIQGRIALTVNRRTGGPQ